MKSILSIGFPGLLSKWLNIWITKALFKPDICLDLNCLFRFSASQTYFLPPYHLWQKNIYINNCIAYDISHLCEIWDIYH